MEASAAFKNELLAPRQFNNGTATRAKVQRVAAFSRKIINFAERTRVAPRRDSAAPQSGDFTAESVNPPAVIYVAFSRASNQSTCSVHNNSTISDIPRVIWIDT